jgi:hypothetical protein
MSSHCRSLIVWFVAASKENQGQQGFVIEVEKVDGSK